MKWNELQNEMLPSSVPGCLISTCITLWTFANSALLQPPCSSPLPHTPHLCPSVRCLLQGWDGTPAASAVPHPVSASAGFNILWSTSQQIAQISVLFFLFSFFFLLILFKFDAVSVLVWYTLYKYMNMNINFCCPGVFLHHHPHAHPGSSRSLSVVFSTLKS